MFFIFFISVSVFCYWMWESFMCAVSGMLMYFVFFMLNLIKILYSYDFCEMISKFFLMFFLMIIFKIFFGFFNFFMLNLDFKSFLNFIISVLLELVSSMLFMYSSSYILYSVLVL